jgi:hypothetical protein
MIEHGSLLPTMTATDHGVSWYATYLEHDRRPAFVALRLFLRMMMGEQTDDAWKTIRMDPAAQTMLVRILTSPVEMPPLVLATLITMVDDPLFMSQP